VIRVVVADDHEILRWGLVETLAREPDLVVVAEVGDAEAAVIASDRLQPDVLLLDLSMPGGGGWAALSGVLTSRPSACVVILSATDDPSTVEAALAHGARAHVSKSEGPERLLQVLRAVAAEVPPVVGAVVTSPDGAGGAQAPGGAGSGDAGAG
jgi:two-component system, NarL family, invasion response regulator UvrY